MIHPKILAALEEIDAALSNGVAFYSVENLAILVEYLERWNRDVDYINAFLATPEESP